MFCQSCNLQYDKYSCICIHCNVELNRLSRSEANYIRKIYDNAESIINCIEYALPSRLYTNLFSHCCFMCDIIKIYNDPQPLFDICLNVQDRVNQ